MSRLNAITIKQLRALRAVADCGTLTGAALRLHLSTPAVHSQIRALEEAAGVPLVTRASDSGRAGLTPEGEAMLTAAERVDNALGQVGEQLAAMRRGLAGRVTLGVVSTAKYFAPRLVRTLKDLCPEVETVLRVANREGVIADLERQAVDLAIMGRPPRHPAVQADPLGPHPPGIVPPPHHRLPGRSFLSATDLLAETFLAREPGSGTRILMTRYLDRIGEGQAINLVEMDSNETIKQAVIAGLGIAFLSLHTVMDELHSGRLVLLDAPGLPMLRHWFLVSPDAVDLTPAARTIRDRILGLGGAFLPR